MPAEVHVADQTKPNVQPPAATPDKPQQYDDSRQVVLRPGTPGDRPSETTDANPPAAKPVVTDVAPTTSRVPDRQQAQQAVDNAHNGGTLQGSALSRSGITPTPASSTPTSSNTPKADEPKSPAATSGTESSGRRVIGRIEAAVDAVGGAVVDAVGGAIMRTILSTDAAPAAVTPTAERPVSSDSSGTKTSNSGRVSPWSTAPAPSRTSADTSTQPAASDTGQRAVVSQPARASAVAEMQYAEVAPPATSSDRAAPAPTPGEAEAAAYDVEINPSPAETTSKAGSDASGAAADTGPAPTPADTTTEAPDSKPKATSSKPLTPEAADPIPKPTDEPADDARTDPSDGTAEPTGQDVEPYSAAGDMDPVQPDGSYQADAERSTADAGSDQQVEPSRNRAEASRDNGSEDWEPVRRPLPRDMVPEEFRAEPPTVVDDDPAWDDIERSYGRRGTAGDNTGRDVEPGDAGDPAGGPTGAPVPRGNNDPSPTAGSTGGTEPAPAAGGTGNDPTPVDPNPVGWQTNDPVTVEAETIPPSWDVNAADAVDADGNPVSGAGADDPGAPTRPHRGTDDGGTYEDGTVIEEGEDGWTEHEDAKPNTEGNDGWTEPEQNIWDLFGMTKEQFDEYMKPVGHYSDTDAPDTADGSRITAAADEPLLDRYGRPLPEVMRGFPPPERLRWLILKALLLGVPAIVGGAAESIFAVQQVEYQNVGTTVTGATKYRIIIHQRGRTAVKYITARTPEEAARKAGGAFNRRIRNGVRVAVKN